MASLFLSCVSNEFGKYRDAIRKDFTRPGLETKIQEDFIAYGGPTLEKLDEYIQRCEAIIHIVGDMTGSLSNDLSLRYINEKYPDFGNRFPRLLQVLKGETGLSYTQWEAYLAIYHGKRLFIVTPAEEAKKSEHKDAAQIASQQTHLNNLRSLGFYDEIKFKTEDELAKKLYQSKLADIIHAIPKTKPLNLPYKSIGSAFKGRGPILKELHEMFSTAPNIATAIAVQGLGGIGKTRLAVEYAWQNLNGYTALLFITATSPELLKTNIANLSVPLILGVSDQDANMEDAKYTAVINWLNQNSRWLLVIDSVDTPETAKEVERLIAQLQHGNVLITTRTDKWSLQVKKKRLDVLEKKDATSFLLETTASEREKTDKDVELADAIAHDLGYLALALEQARAYIVTKEISFEKYRNDWEKIRGELLSWFDEHLMQYPASVAITWQTSFNQLSGEARILLNRLAWLAPDPIPKTLLEVELPDAEQINARNAWEELKQYSLATSTEDKKAFTIHKLVQDVTCGKMDAISQSQKLREALNWINSAFKGDPANVFDWPNLDPLISHVLSLIAHAQIKEINDPTSGLISRVALLFSEKAQYGTAEPLMRRALEMDEQDYGANHPNVAADLNNLGLLLQDTNRWKEAEPLMRRALKIHEQTYGPTHNGDTAYLNNLAQILSETSRWKEAEPLMRRALEINVQTYGPNHTEVAIVLSSLGQLLKETNRLDEAELLFRRALEIDEQWYDANHPKIAKRLNNLGLLFQETNRPREAEPLMRRSLEIDEQCYGANHPNVAIRLNNLALILQDTDRMQEAELLFRKALEIDEQCYGADHPDIALRLNNLANLLHNSNRWMEAEPLMRRALKIEEQSYGADHYNVAIGLNNLGELLKDTNRLKEAEPLLKQSFIILFKSLGLDHPTTMGVLNNYIGLLKAMGLSNKKIEAIIIAIIK